MFRFRNLLFFMAFQIAAIAQADLQIAPGKDEWISIESKSFFSKPTTLIEHRVIPGLRGIMSRKTNYVRPGLTFDEKARLQDICKNIPASYLATKHHTVVRAKVVQGLFPHCRIQVRDSSGPTIEQILFVDRIVKKSRTLVTYTVTFFYPPSEEAKSVAEIGKFLKSAVTRGKDG